MTYFEDLTAYVFLPDTLEGLAEGVEVLNVGWLDAAHAYRTGTAPDGFEHRLGGLCARHATARTRGLHECELCAEDEVDFPVSEHVEGEAEPVVLGGAEVRVTDEAGRVVYAAPDLVLHYVVKHRYLPPAEFVEAVLAGRTAS